MTTSGNELRVRYVTWVEYGASGVYESQVMRLVDLLAESVDVELLALVRRGAVTRLEPPRRGRLMAGPLASRWPLRTLRVRSRALEAEISRLPSPGILHCRGPLATIAALGARASSPGWKVIHDYRDFDALAIEDEQGASRWTRRLAALERRACREADLVSVVSEPLRDVVVRDYGVDGARVEIHPTGVETGGFAWGDGARAAARRELGIGPEPLVGYVGSAAHWQGIDACVSAAASLATSAGASFLVLSQDAEVIRALARAAGLPPERLLARAATREEVRRLLCAADVALLPRRVSAISLVSAPVKYTEYLAAGVPVVAVRSAGAFADEVERLGLGGMAGAADAESIAKAATAVLAETPDALREMRSRCRQVAVQKYDLGAIAAAYVDSYRRILAGTAVQAPSR